MSKIVRIGDQGQGFCRHPSHLPVVPLPMTGNVTTGAANTEIEGANVSRIGDVVTGLCGHTGIIIEGSEFEIEGAGVARVGDKFDGDFYGVLISGTSNIDVK